MTHQMRLVGIASIIALWGCGGATLGASCGEGTTEVDGVCILADASLPPPETDVGDADEPNETENDAEPATDTSADAAAAETGIDAGVDTADDAEEDASGSDADSSDADASGADADVSDADADTAEPTSDAATDGADHGTIDVGAEVLPPIYGDECPGSLINVNCSTTCGGLTSTCGQATCATNDAPNLQINTASELPFIMRTPAYPGVDPKCQPRCGAGDTVYGMAVQVNLTSVSGYGIRVRVSDPWTIRQFSVLQPWCSVFGHKGSCAIVPLPTPRILIATSDPNAPSRNVYIDVAKDKNACD